MMRQYQGPKMMKICPRCERGMTKNTLHGVCGRCNGQLYKSRMANKKMVKFYAV